nr:hypothetical protein [Frankia sp. ACN1ag]
MQNFTGTHAHARSIRDEGIIRPVVHRRLSYRQMRDRLTAEVPVEFAAMLADLDRAIAGGAEDRVTDTVHRLTGRPPRAFRALLEREMRSSR